MIDKEKLRGSDLVSGGIFLVVGIVIIAMALQMPLSDSFGGVQSQWYVSPALLPLVIGACLIILSICIIVYALKNGGVEQFKKSLAEKKGKSIVTDKNLRMAAVILPLCTLVYVHLKAFDFYLTITIYLLFSTSVFYFEDMEFLKKSLKLYLVQFVVMVILVATGLSKTLNKLFFATMDIVGFIILISLTVNVVLFAKRSDDVIKKKRRIVLLISFLVPLLVIPLFRYALRVPMPKEGVIINVMSQIYYSLR
ncbi:MAG: tripartite tricarboxylate transporter TctB family protein [Spirochaetales bacterium]|nr:tripartite tricarboxylate transporter TctB family protein [Spirochaetales bacterium]